MDSSSELNNLRLGMKMLVLAGQLRDKGFVEMKMIDGEMHIILKLRLMEKKDV